MQGLTLPRFLLLVITAIAGLGIYGRLDIQSKRRELDADRAVLDEMRAGHDLKRLRLEAANHELHAVQEQLVAREVLTDELKFLKEQIAQLEAEQRRIADEFGQQVNLVRANIMGKPLPDFVTTNGQMIRAGTVTKLTDTEMTVSTAQGIVRIPVAQLPLTLKQRLRVDMPPGRDAAVSPVIASTGASPASSVPERAGEPEPPVKLSQAEQEKIAAIETSIRALERERVALNHTKSAYLRQVADYRLKDEIAKYSGAPLRYAGTIPKIEAAALELNERIAELSTKVTDLQIRIEDIKTSGSPR